MSHSAEGKLSLQIMGLILAVVCPVVLIWRAAETRQQIDSLNWPSVSGEIKGINLKTWVDRRNITQYNARLNYSYLVNGKEYQSDLTDLGPGKSVASKEKALALMSHYSPGMTVTVYYDPADPQVGIIEKGIPDIHIALLAILGIGTIAGVTISYFTIREIRNNIRRPATNEAVIDS